MEVDLKTTNIEELRIKLSNIFVKFENDEYQAQENITLQQRNEDLVNVLLALQNISVRVRQLQVFSRNETIIDINSEDIPFIFCSNLIAKVHLNLRSDDTRKFIPFRIFNLKKAIIFHNFFLQECEAKGAIDKLEKTFLSKLWKILDEDDTIDTENRPTIDLKSALNREDPGSFREYKINSYRRKKELQEQLTGSEEEMIVLELKLEVLSAIDSLISVHSELNLLEMNQSGNEYPNAKSSAPPASKNVPSVIKIDENNEVTVSVFRDGKMQNVDNPRTEDISHITRSVQGLGQFFSKPKTKLEIESEIFRPSWTQPTMTIEEFGEIEKERMINSEEMKKKQLSERGYKDAKMDVVNEKGLEDNEEIYDIATKNQREWDDWKDDTPKGSGYTKRY